MDQELNHARFLCGEVDKALRTLGEHFDALQLIGTFVDDDGLTHLMTRGSGNWYARVGACREFLDKDQAQTTAYAIGEVMMEDEED